MVIITRSASVTMSSLLSTVFTCVGASLPVVFLAGLLWVTTHMLDNNSSCSPRKRRMPGSWDSNDDEHIFVSPRPPRHSPSVMNTVSSAFTSLTPLAHQPRPIASTSLFVSAPSHCPNTYIQKRPSARASSPGVSQTSTSPLYSYIRSFRYRSTSPMDEACRKTLRYSPAYGRPAKPWAFPGRKIPTTVTRGTV
jgi:hypothetical protein